MQDAWTASDHPARRSPGPRSRRRPRSETGAFLPSLCDFTRDDSQPPREGTDLPSPNDSAHETGGPAAESVGEEGSPPVGLRTAAGAAADPAIHYPQERAVLAGRKTLPTPDAVPLSHAGDHASPAPVSGLPVAEGEDVQEAGSGSEQNTARTTVPGDDAHTQDEKGGSSLPSQAVSQPNAPESRTGGSSWRLGSLDAFRGCTVLGMLLVNNTALDQHTPTTLTHADWGQGIHVADLVFPWFLFIVGAAIPFSAASRRNRGSAVGSHLGKALGRTVSLLAVGCFVDSNLAHTPSVGLGVLQLIGLAYLIGVLGYSAPRWLRVPILASLLAAHWALIRHFPVPGWGPGRWTETQNAILYLNEAYLAPLHLKGLASVLPTAAMVLLGTIAGDWLREAGERRLSAANRLLAAGILLALAGAFWSRDLPFSKPYWTGSYIVATAGLGAVVLGLLSILADVAKASWAVFPLVVLGSNAIAAYVLPILCKVHILREWTWTLADGSRLPLAVALQSAAFQHWGRIGGGWVYMAGYILFWWLVLFYFYRRQWFLRL